MIGQLGRVCTCASRTHVTRPDLSGIYVLDGRRLYSVVTETTPSVCHQCNKVYKHRHTLTRHLRYECNKKPAFSCIYCNYAARRKYILLEHVRASHREDFPNFSQNIYKFLYPDADVAKKVLRLYWSHVENAHQQIPNERNWAVSLREVREYLQAENPSDSSLELRVWARAKILLPLKGRPGFQCNKCLKVYSQPGNLNRHEKYECQKSYRFLCDLCNYKCFRNNVLILHKSKKHGVVPPKRLTPSDDSELVDWSVQVPDLQQKLQILQRTQKASEGMRSGEAINLHVLSAQNPPQRKPADAHDNEAWRDADLNSYQTRPLPSSAWRVCFRDGRNMPGLACPKCGNKFTRIDNLKRHINYICGMKPQFKCVYCAYASKHKYVLALHIRTKHFPFEDDDKKFKHFLSSD
ncbi:hypothetical protein HUJ04_008570 [Dendroctonus ponderosae]|nr:hypothetical protein HUJ04_008570 [Dendroctonus ponderosae]